MVVTVRDISGVDYAAWDQYVRGHKKGTFCHLVGWKTVVESGAGHRCPYLIAEEAGKIVGILPLVVRESLLFGKALISSMFAVYGGVLASSEAAYAALDEAAWAIAAAENIDALTYRSVEARHEDRDGWTVDADSSATFQRELADNPESILLSIPRKQRAVVRKSLKAGLHCDWGSDLETFYSLYAESVRNLGTPVFSKKLFRGFLDVFQDDVEVQVIRTPEGQPVASLMSFYFTDYVLPYYAGGNREARKYGAHDFMYYQLMVRAAARGAKLFDFGRSKVGSGPYKFKKNWGFEPTLLQYETRLADGAEPQDLSPNNKKFVAMVNLWKKLPLPVANFLGPSIARHLG